VTIRLKVVLLVASLCVGLGMAEVLLARHVLIPSFAELERADARTAMRRIDYALELTLERLQLSATDWGNWADTYRFVRDHNADYVSANLTDVALRELNVNAFAVVDGDGNIVESRELDLAHADRPMPLDLLSGKALPRDFPWRTNLHDGRPTQGLVRTNRGILMLAAAPVLDGKGGGPSRGMVLMGRLFSNSEVMRLGARAQASLQMLPAVAAAPGEELIETDRVTEVYRSFRDLYGHPLMRLRVDVPREITARGRSAVAALSLSLLLAATCVLALLIVALNRLVLNPLAHLTRHAIAIGEDKDLTARLASRSRDEIGTLARELDRMVERLADSRCRLVDQSFEAGFAELAKGVLHNLGNAMTPLGVRLARLGERLREAPAEDAVEAVAELERPSADAARRADVEQFVRMACRELARTVTAAREDLDVMSRQASVVQSALAEQTRAARNTHVIEPVRLIDLVLQSLEIVPDDCRQRLQVETDESLRQVGVVRVARTILRLILQNIIINASDAVRDAAKDRGRLRIFAHLLRDEDGEQLQLTCQDDGIGIAADHLDRIFEKNFSTKSKETNSGIGLHWCANVIGALGGRIWATSDGRGHGASIHLVVPLEVRKVRLLAGAA